MATATRKPKPGRNDQDAEPSLAPAKLLQLYRDMLLIRRFEEKAGQMYGMGLIGGFCHLYIGEEAVVVGVLAAVKEGDTVVTSYRDHGHMLACGMDPKGVMAELTGRRDGYSKGKGGSMHMFSREKNFFGGHGIVGAQVPIGTGIAFAHHYRATMDCKVCVTFMGDGAMNSGPGQRRASTWRRCGSFAGALRHREQQIRHIVGTSDMQRSSASHDLFEPRRALRHSRPSKSTA